MDIASASTAAMASDSLTLVSDCMYWPLAAVPLHWQAPLSAPGHTMGERWDACARAIASS